jgi:hypothetical protein
MNGELLPVWDRSWQEVWLPLSKSSMAPEDLFVELVGGLATPPTQPTPPAAPPGNAFNVEGVLVDLIALNARQEYQAAMEKYTERRGEYESALTSEALAKSFFRKLLNEASNEAKAIGFLELTHAALLGYGNARLTARFRELVSKFISRFSLRYELHGTFSLHATIPGVFSKLISEVKRIAVADAHLNSLLTEFEESFADLKSNRTQARMKTCLQKQFNLLEALGSNCPNVTGTTLGAICNQLDFPHATIKAIGEKLYGFGSNYPGVRHAGNANSALRQLDMRDFVSLSLMLASFTPYVTHGLDPDRCYSG